MGQEIVYCIRCATRIVGTDFERGKAFRVSGKAVCAACVPSLTPAEQQEVSLSSTRMKAARAAPPLSQSTASRIPVARAEHHAPPPPPSSSKTPLLIAGVLGAIVVVAGLAVALKPSASLPPPEAPTPPAVTKTPAPPEEKKEDPLLRDAREAIEAARAKAKSAPNDLDGQLAAWEEAARKAALTPLFRDASAGLQEIRDRRAALKPAEPEKPAPGAPSPETPPTPAQPSAEAKAYLSKWESAMSKASARDFDGAIADLGRAAAEASEEAVKKDARADAENLRRARTLLAEGLGVFPKLNRGQAVAMTLRPDGKRIEGVTLRAGAARVEIRQGDATVFVEAEDVSAASLATLLGVRAEADRRAFAVLCLLEGDREAAEQLAGFDAFPPRYWGYAKDAAPRVPKPSPREMEARSRFYAAEIEFAKADTLAAAVQKYKSLAADYADTRVVKSDPIRIQKRAEAGRDYLFFTNALKGTGTFAPAPAPPRIEVALASKADVEGNALENFVEAEFAALPDLTYRCWALLGGCCQETFVFYLQTTEATDLHPKTRQRTSIDPGAAYASTVRPSISSLKKTHEEHKIKGSKSHPKTAARWEWVPIPLPKYAAPGAKKIRLITEQQGFAVGAVVVSSTRTGPPTEAEMKEEVARVRVLRAASEEGLVGWWRLDDGSGASAADSSEGAHPLALKGNAKWAAGKVGGALKCEGGADSADATMPLKLETLTVSAWIKHDSFGQPQQRYVTLGNEVAVIRCDRDHDLHFYIKTNGELRHLMAMEALEVGKWTHVAGTWDGKTQRLYKDGVLVGTQAPGGSLTGPIERVGISAPGEAMKGLIDEVKVYDRALGDAEIQKQVADGNAGVIADLSVPPPAPIGRPWRPLFDGSTNACLRGSNSGWTVDTGALTYVPGTNDAAQTREEISDGELRIRFEVKDAERLWFNLRQGAAAGYGVLFENDLKSLEGKPHELIFTAKGEQVTATLDGKPHPVTVHGAGRSGCLQFNGKGRVIRILSLEMR